MSAQPPPLPAARKKSSWVAIVTTLAYPGTGQFLQGRRATGIFLTGVTTIVFLWGVEEIFRGFLEGLRASLDGGPSDMFASFRHAATPFRALGICYLVSFLDAVIAHWILNRKKVAGRADEQG